jgi:hypothetical protein
VTNPDGSKKAMPGMKFRVKNVPNPSPYFAGKSVNDENIKKTELTAAAGVIAKMVELRVRPEVRDGGVPGNHDRERCSLREIRERRCGKRQK